MPIKTAISLLSPAGPKARLSILIFHRVLPAPDPLTPYEPTIEQFGRIASWIRHWFNVLPLPEAVARLKKDQLPARAAVITFDDGYADNYNCALPVLQQHGLPATFFIACGFLGKGIMWNDVIIESIRHASATRIHMPQLGLGTLDLASDAAKHQTLNLLIHAIKHLDPVQRSDAVECIHQACAPAGLPALMMTKEQLVALSDAGMEIGAHTVTHPILAKLSDDNVRSEIADSRDELSHMLGKKITTFAYPNGKQDQDYTKRTVEIVKSLGFDAAVTTNWGYGHRHSGLHELPRFSPWDQTKLRYGLRILGNLRRAPAV